MTDDILRQTILNKLSGASIDPGIANMIEDMFEKIRGVEDPLVKVHMDAIIYTPTKSTAVFNYWKLMQKIN